ncbi:MAG: 4Fe-4S binding protein [Planctomycetes bacterium]|nr:4Fe-4S binding protein [Planctomycetota bacterium]
MRNSGLKFDSQKLRWLVQVAFFILIVFIGWRFYLFVKFCESGGTATFVPRPPGVEAFLPIGAMMGVKYFFLTGIIDPIHPAGFVIFVTILLTALFFRRGFCSWICPVSTISEWLWRGFEGCGGKNIRLPKIADIVLRSVKYLLLAFFLHILFVMDKTALESFYQNVPYIRVADVKMLKFFTEMATLTLIVIILLVIGSFINKNFWCRYFCPYGALLGILGWISPFRVARDKDKCIDCGKCTKACPVYIVVENKKTVTDPECLVCYDCVQACPKPGALDLKIVGPNAKIHYALYAAILIGFFGILTTAGRLTGNWHTSIPVKEFVDRVQHIHDPMYQHRQGKFATENGALETRPDNPPETDKPTL